MSLPRLYDRLDPKERFQLALRAVVRRDKEEARRLVDSCPKKVYEMHDYEFLGPWRLSLELTLFFNSIWYFYYWRFSVLDLVVVLFQDPERARALMHEVMVGRKSHGETLSAPRKREVPNQVWESLADAFENLAALHRAFTRFCREVVKIDPELMAGPTIPGIEVIQPLFENEVLRPSQEMEADYFEFFARRWRENT